MNGSLLERNSYDTDLGKEERSWGVLGRDVDVEDV